MSSLMDRLMRLPRWKRWIVSFTAIFFLTAGIYAVCVLPLVLWTGFQCSAAVGGAIGTGLGCAIAEATIISMQ